MSEESKIAVTIITGFLGSGKTTFINQLLRKYPNTKFALVENEFGEASIDTKLIKGINASHMFELKNGCICCNITNEFELILLELAGRFPEVEHLLIETTGIADPAPVIQPFFKNGELISRYRFNGTVCLADAMNFHRYPAKRVALKQIVVADSVIITKSEDFDVERLTKFSDKLRSLNPWAKQYISAFGNVPQFRLEDEYREIRFLPEIGYQYPEHEMLQTKTFRFSIPFDKKNFTEKLAYNLDLFKNEIYRIKGIISFKNELYLFVLQGVGGSFEILESEKLNSGNESNIVIIGSLNGVDISF